MNIKRLAYTVRRPEEAFEMPLDYDKAPLGPAPSAGEGAIDRAAVVSAVERYLASRGIAVSPSAAATSATSCGCSTPQSSPKQSTIAGVANFPPCTAPGDGGHPAVRGTGRFNRRPAWQNVSASAPVTAPQPRAGGFSCTGRLAPGHQRRKIYIGPKTSSRLYARLQPLDILVLA
jgi:hypothetical protein